MNDLSDRDRNFYRVLLGAEPIPSAELTGEQHRAEYYDSIAEMTNSRLYARLNQSLDQAGGAGLSAVGLVRRPGACHQGSVTPHGVYPGDPARDEQGPQAHGLRLRMARGPGISCASFPCGYGLYGSYRYRGDGYGRWNGVVRWLEAGLWQHRHGEPRLWL